MKTVAFDFPNIRNLNREDPYMYKAYSKELEKKDYHCMLLNTEISTPEVLISYKPRGYNIGFLRRCKEAGTKMIYIYPDIRVKPPEWICNVSTWFDYFLCHDTSPIWKEALPNSKVLHFKQGVEPSLFDLKTPFSVDFTRRNWSFIGSYYKRRMRFYDALEKQRKGGLIWGNGWEDCPNEVPYTGHEAYNLMYAQVLHRSLVTISWTYYKRRKNAWSTRIYKTMASGVPLLSDRVNGINKVFKEGKHILHYDSTTNLLKIIADPLGTFGKETLEEVALRGKEEVVNKHTYNHRAKELVKLCNL